mmetsp:Transcript_88701/g.177350  ORF Transcript_88701/g.177350 Transcript_88701/m.177350 type:complete len:273 (+) Transcript_88701:39-857(+)
MPKVVAKMALILSTIARATSGFHLSDDTAVPFPVYPEQFTVKTREYSSSGELTLNQTLVWDELAQRTHMKADFEGQGFLEQIVRSDVAPGYFVQTSSSDPAHEDPSTWDCSNMTMEEDIGDFWEAPSRSRYVGNETVNGVVCGKWVYADLELASEYVFWGTDELPCATAQLVPGRSGGDGGYMWLIDFLDFTPGPPPLDLYDVTPGVTCPLAEGASSEVISGKQPPSSPFVAASQSSTNATALTGTTGALVVKSALSLRKTLASLGMVIKAN